MAPTRVAILGGTGYTALELAKLLLRHPHAEIVAVTSREPQRLSDAHPILSGRLDLMCEPLDAAKLADIGVEAAFGCLPHGASRAAVASLLDKGIRVIDLSADYRLKDAAQYAEWYGEAHDDPANLAHAVYGLPELFREQIRGAKLVANPGCYPQTAVLGLAPFLAAGAVEPRGIIVNSLSGISGAGRTPKLGTHFPECHDNIVAYNVGKHRHTPEMEQALAFVAGKPVEVLFAPHLAPMNRGIHSTIYATPTRPIADAEALQLARDYYRNEPFVRVRDAFPATKDTAGTNYLDLSCRVVRGHLVVFAVEDNLTRGASGVAVQNFNLMFGYPEAAALG